MYNIIERMTPSRVIRSFSSLHNKKISKMNYQTSLISSLYEIGAVQFGEFTLKSGKISPIYINLRKIISYPKLLVSIAAIMMQKMEGEHFDVVCGVPYTALPIATCMSIDYKIPMIMRRKEKKDYGTKQIIEGVFNEGQRCLVVEDVVTSGTSVMETTADLQAAGLIVTDVIALIDREQGGRENLEKKYHFHSVLTLTQILETLLHSTLVSPDEKEIIDQLLTQMKNRE